MLAEVGERKRNRIGSIARAGAMSYSRGSKAHR
jgi:hypothetical protein